MKKNKEKELEMVDLERVINKFGFYTSLCLLPIAIINVFVWANHWLSGIIFGWCICVMCISLLSVVVGEHNFKCVLQDFEKIRKEVGMKDAKELQSGRGQDTTNDNEEA